MSIYTKFSFSVFSTGTIMCVCVTIAGDAGKNAIVATFSSLLSLVSPILFDERQTSVLTFCYAYDLYLSLYLLVRQMSVVNRSARCFLLLLFPHYPPPPPSHLVTMHYKKIGLSYYWNASTVWDNFKYYLQIKACCIRAMFEADFNQQLYFPTVFWRNSSIFNWSLGHSSAIKLQFFNYLLANKVF